MKKFATGLGTCVLLAAVVLGMAAWAQKSATPERRSNQSLALDVSVSGQEDAKMTVRIGNSSERPVFLQAQPDSGLGFVIQTRDLPQADPREVHPLNGAKLGTRTVRLEPGEIRTFESRFEEPPFSLRVGVFYVPSGGNASDEWRLRWSGWWDALSGASEPQAEPTRASLTAGQ